MWKLHKSYVKFTLYLHKTYKRFKNNVGISKDLYKSYKGFTKIWKFQNNVEISKDLQNYEDHINPM